MLEQDIQKVLDIQNATILDAFMKASSVLSTHKKAAVSISGGSDSDIVLDLMERVRADTGCDIMYVFWDTGFEYRATRKHLVYLEDTYGITINRVRADRIIPYCVKDYGQPFISKYASTQIERLQKNGFQWEDEPLDVLMSRYPDCISAIKWWSNAYNGGKSTYDIDRNHLLKEFMIANPPTFRISSKCCTCAKKKTSHTFNEQNNIDLMCIGVRKAEGGARNKNPNTTCFSYGSNGVDVYRPLFWFVKDDCEAYRKLFHIKRSDCYELWGFKRTGCVGCPFNKNVFNELEIVEQFEPNMSRAARLFFKDSYEYTKRFHEYRHQKEFGERVARTNVWQRMFDAIEDSPEWSDSI